MTVLSLSPLAIARTLGGEACGNSVHVPGAGHSRRDRSLHITVDPAAPDGFVVCDHAGERSRAKDLAAKDFVREALGLPFDRRAPRRPLTAPAASHGRSEASRLDDRERTARAFALWPKSRPPAGTPVEAYLLRRGLTLPDRAEEAIRFHGFCPFAGKREFDELAAALEAEVEHRPDERARLAYERCLHSVAQFDYAKLDSLLSRWNVDGDPFWLVRKAGLLAEVGRLEEADRLSNEARIEIRRRTLKGVDDLASWSREAYALLLRSAFVLAMRHTSRGDLPLALALGLILLGLTLLVSAAAFAVNRWAASRG